MLCIGQSASEASQARCSGGNSTSKVLGTCSQIVKKELASLLGCVRYVSCVESEALHRLLLLSIGE